MLGRLLKNLASEAAARAAVGKVKPIVDQGLPAVLNVGGNSKAIPIPQHYAGWQHLLLDIDPKGGAEVVCDARNLDSLAPGQFDSIYCSHNLEHYHHHEVPKVLAGFAHVLKEDGFAEIRVPDMPAVFRKMLDDGLDIEDVLYDLPVGPIYVHDVIYGWSREIAASGNDFFAHKTGFSRQSLRGVLLAASFAEVWDLPPLANYELRALAFKRPSTPAQRTLLGIPLDLAGAAG
jgi:predicted SAM-dependent methyltransferase